MKLTNFLVICQNFFYLLPIANVVLANLLSILIYLSNYSYANLSILSLIKDMHYTVLTQVTTACEAM